MSLRRRNREPSSAEVEPPAKIPKLRRRDAVVEPPRGVPLPRRSRSLRYLARELFREMEEDFEIADDVDGMPFRFRRRSPPGDVSSANEVSGEEDQAPPSDGEEAAQAVQDVQDANDHSRCRRRILEPQQQLLYYAAFKMHFGVSDRMSKYLQDFCQVMSMPSPYTMSETKSQSRSLDSAFKFVRDLRQKLRRAEGAVARCRTPTLPDGVYLSSRHLTKTWVVEANPPFKAFNLSELLASWSLPVRARREDHLTHATDFLRHYFARACEPANEVQAYTYRTSGRFIKSDTLKDLPTNVVEKLVGCCLDGVGLGASELELTAEHLIVHPTRYWTNLGNNDYARAKAFVALKKQRESWTYHYRVAIARAMNDIRQYVDGPDETRIVPASKIGRKVPRARPSTAITAQD